MNLNDWAHTVEETIRGQRLQQAWMNQPASITVRLHADGEIAESLIGAANARGRLTLQDGYITDWDRDSRGTDFTISFSNMQVDVTRDIQPAYPLRNINVNVTIKEEEKTKTESKTKKRTRYDMVHRRSKG